jgi:hypothetical protein
VVTTRNDTVIYEYDFGDDWRHQVVLLDALRRDFALSYPRCTGGARACPPEDCGGVTGYADIVTGLANGTLDQDIRDWLPEGYDPERFDPTAVRFSDPHRRLAYTWYGDAERGDDPFG